MAYCFIFLGNLVQFAVDVAHTTGGQGTNHGDEVHQGHRRLHGADGGNGAESAYIGQQFYDELSNA